MENVKVEFLLNEEIKYEGIKETFQNLMAIELKEVKEVVLNAEDVEEIDLIGLQTIYSFIKSAEQQGVSVSWDNPTIPLFEATTDLGFNKALGI